MVIHLKESVSAEEAKSVAEKLEAVYFKEEGRYVLVTSSKVKELAEGK